MPRRRRRHLPRPRLRGLLLAALLPAAGTAGCGSAHPATSFRNAGDAAAPSPYVHLRDIDKKGPGATTTVALHSCPQSGDVTEMGENAWGLLCATIQRLADGTAVTMQCWVSTTAPDPAPADKSAKWFKVTVTQGPYAGQEGWVWSDLVAQQTPNIPKCASIGSENDPPPGPYTPPPLALAIKGSCTTAGGTLTGVSSGFTPGAQYDLSVTKPDGSPYPLTQSTHTVNDNGSITWTWSCQSDPAGSYTTAATDVATGRTIYAGFLVATPPAPTPSPSTSPSPPISSTPPTTQPPTPSTTSTTPPPPTTTAVVTPPPPPGPATWAEQSGTLGSPTFTDPANASGPGTRIPPMTQVNVLCRVYDPAIKSANPDGWWYKIDTDPWHNYYAVANTFWNGDIPGQKPYTHNTDWAVPVC